MSMSAPAWSATTIPERAWLQGENIRFGAKQPALGGMAMAFSPLRRPQPAATLTASARMTVL